MKPKNTDSGRLPVLPLRDFALRRGDTQLLFVGRPRSLAAMAAARSHDNRLLLVAQQDSQKDVHDLSDLREVGTICTLLEDLKLPDGNHRVVVRGEAECRLLSLHDAGTHHAAEVSTVASATDEQLGVPPPPVVTEKPGDIVRWQDLPGFDPGGDPYLEWERSGRLWLVFSQMPPTWNPEAEYSNFGRFATFDRELEAAIGCKVIWDDREFFFIEQPRPDSADRIQAFLLEYRRTKAPS